MAVGDVKIRNLRELRGDKRNVVRPGHHPRRVTHAIFAGEIHGGRIGGLARDKFIERRDGAIRQKHRAGLRVERLDVAHAVVFLVHAGQLVFFDDVGQIFLTACGGDEAGLHMVAHDLPIQIKVRLVILLERALRNQRGEIFFTFGINCR